MERPRVSYDVVGLFVGVGCTWGFAQKTHVPSILALRAVSRRTRDEVRLKLQHVYDAVTVRFPVWPAPAEAKRHLFILRCVVVRQRPYPAHNFIGVCHACNSPCRFFGRWCIQCTVNLKVCAMCKEPMKICELTGRCTTTNLDPLAAAGTPGGRTLCTSCCQPMVVPDKYNGSKGVCAGCSRLVGKPQARVADLRLFSLDRIQWHTLAELRNQSAPNQLLYKKHTNQVRPYLKWYIDFFA